MEDQLTHVRRRFTVRRGLGIAAFLAPAVVFVGVFTYYPMITGSQMAFRQWNLADLTDTSWVGLGNFRAVFADLHPADPRVLKRVPRFPERGVAVDAVSLEKVG